MAPVSATQDRSESRRLCARLHQCQFALQSRVCGGAWYFARHRATRARETENSRCDVNAPRDHEIGPADHYAAKWIPLPRVKADNDELLDQRAGCESLLPLS